MNTDAILAIQRRRRLARQEEPMSEEVATAFGDREEIARLHAELDAARSLLAGQQRLIVEQARLLGRCQEAFGIILQFKNAAACHRTARRMRTELEKARSK